MSTRTLTDRLQFGATLAKSAMGTYAQPVAAVVAFLAATESIEGGPSVEDMLDGAVRDAVRAAKAQWPGAAPDASAVAVLVVDCFRQRHLDEMAIRMDAEVVARTEANVRTSDEVLRANDDFLARLERERLARLDYDPATPRDRGYAAGGAWAVEGIGAVPKDDGSDYARGFSAAVADVLTSAVATRDAALADGKPICGATDDARAFGGTAGEGRICILPAHPTTSRHIDGTKGPWIGPFHLPPSPPADPPPPGPVGAAEPSPQPASPTPPAIPNGEDPPDYQEGYAAAVAWANDRTGHDPRADTDERSLSFRQGVVDGERASESKRDGPLVPEAVDASREIREVLPPPAVPAPTPAAKASDTSSASGVIPPASSNRPAIKMPTPAPTPTKVVATLPPAPTRALPRPSLPKPKPR